jgi:hypothetical protein
MQSYCIRSLLAPLSSESMFSAVDTKSSAAVADATRAVFLRHHPGAHSHLVDRLFRDIEDIFQGRYLDYLPLDTRYHDFEHTLQAALCLVRLLDGRYRTPATPALTARGFEMAVAAVLLHDTGYLKLRSDRLGSGAKYTLVHVVRSCAFAASYLPTIGFQPAEVEAIVIAIRCTGPRSNVLEMNLADSLAHLLGSVVATADFLGQMAASDYVDELPFLYAEIEEADGFANTPAGDRLFRSHGDLLAKTPHFWEKIVLPKLQQDFGGVYRFLAQPYPEGSNPYVLAIEANVARVRELISRAAQARAASAAPVRRIAELPRI